MTISRTTRFGLYRWSSAIDAFTRSQMDASHENIETYGLKMLRGATLPESGSASYERTFFLNTTDNKLYYYTTDDANGEWIRIEPNGIKFTIAKAKGDTLVAPAPDVWDRRAVGTRNQVFTVVYDEENELTADWRTILNNRGDLLSSDGTVSSILPVGSNSTTLRANSATTSGLQWGLIVEANIANSAVTTEKIANNNVTTSVIADSAVTETRFADGAIVNSKIQNLGITTPKIADENVTTSKFNDGAVTSAKLATDSVSTIKITDSAVVSSVIQDGAVITEKIANDAVTENKIANFAVTSPKFVASSVINSKILDSAVITAKFADGAVTTPKILDDAITNPKFADGGVGSSKFALLSVTTEKIADLSVDSQVIANDAVTTPKIADSAVTTAKLTDLVIIERHFADASVTEAKIANNNITDAKFRKSAPLSIVGNPTSSTGQIQDIQATVDHTSLKRTGSSIGFGLIETPNIGVGSITSAKIANGAIFDSKVNNAAAITLTKLANGTLPPGIKVTTANYTNRSFTLSKLSNAPDSSGVGIWLSYNPTFYFVPAFNYEQYNKPFYGVQPGWIVRWDRLNNITSYPLSTSRYTVHYAKYCRINNLCYVNVRIEYTYQWDNIGANYKNSWSPSLYNGTVLTGDGGAPCEVMPKWPFFTLPFAPVDPDYTTVGSFDFYSDRWVFTQSNCDYNQYRWGSWCNTATIYNGFLAAMNDDNLTVRTFPPVQNPVEVIGSGSAGAGGFRNDGDDDGSNLRNRLSTMGPGPFTFFNFSIVYEVAT